jgi:hypothetical protein
LRPLLIVASLSLQRVDFGLHLFEAAAEFGSLAAQSRRTPNASTANREPGVRKADPTCVAPQPNVKRDRVHASDGASMAKKWSIYSKMRFGRRQNDCDVSVNQFA